MSLQSKVSTVSFRGISFLVAVVMLMVGLTASVAMAQDGNTPTSAISLTDEVNGVA